MKSSDKMYLSVLQTLIGDILLSHNVRGVARDIQTLEHRVEHEGISFLTKTLPVLEAAILQGLETGTFVCPTSFKKKKGTALPRLFSGLLTYVFSEDGFLLQEYDTEALRHLRQLTCMFKKTALPHNQSAKEAQYEKYCKAEVDMAEVNRRCRNFSFNETQRQVIAGAREIIHDLCQDVNLEDLRPKNGPGSTACRSDAREKWAFDRHLPRLFSWTFGDYLYRYEPKKDHPCLTARLVEVPKDSKGPRLISMEPREYQWIQQGLWSSIERSMKRSFFGKNIRFRDSMTNGKLALQSSITRKNATIDWSSASDRLAYHLVKMLFPNRLFKAMDLASSREVEVPWQHEPVRMEKFSPMGNALCFPVESMVFYALATAATAVKYQTYLGAAAKKVHVYGDDTIVPVDVADFVIQQMESFGMAHNTQKTFSRGHFRESCGVDAWHGAVVTPRYFRGVFNGGRTCHNRRLGKKEKQNIIRIDAFADQLYLAGYWRTAEFLHVQVEEALGGLYPCVSARSPLLGRRVHYGPMPPAETYDPYLQSPTARGYVKTSPKQGWGAAIEDGYPRDRKSVV